MIFLNFFRKINTVSLEFNIIKPVTKFMQKMLFKKLYKISISLTSTYTKHASLSLTMCTVPRNA